jgi:cell division protein FtsQ
MFPLLLFVLCFAFSFKKQEGRVCKSIKIEIENQNGNFFINENDIVEIITKKGNSMVINMPIAELSLKELEDRVEAHKFVESAEVYTDHGGNLRVEVQQAKPIARIFRARGSDSYISESGEILPVSERFTARVILVNGPFFNQYEEQGLLKDEKGEQVFNFIKRVTEDEFWSAQFAQLTISSAGKLTIYPQVTKQKIEFGYVNDSESKLKKLKIFYDKILPDRGWNTYERVNLQFKDQIICE